MFGDLNYNLLQHDSDVVSDLLDIMSDNSFYSLMNKPTRITDTTATIGSHMWTNLYSENIKTAVLLNPVSCHLPELTCYYNK